ncbi:MAG TPA: SUMF1/EgtB/PvdO family nonheme iron enzyme [Polyangia bacterium]|nr:SUMF1/EgtB/PvdO family nonheme iron enzyme [Polyangia bacterium]
MEIQAAPEIEEIAWCLVEATSFARGSTYSPDEQPVTTVHLSAYRISRYPVLNRQFAQFLSAGGYDDPRWWTPLGWRQRTQHGWREPAYWHDPLWNHPRMPVTGVSWWEASAFAAWAGASLPSEAQWEYAAKGPGQRLYPWGDEPPTLQHALFAPDCCPPERRGAVVDAHPANVSWAGCFEMAGNVAEWCLDNSRPRYSETDAGTDPVFSTREDDYHVVRGGSGLHDQDYLRCTARESYPPALRDNVVGIRLIGEV